MASANYSDITGRVIGRWSGGGGGGPVPSEGIVGNTTTIDNSALADLTWDTSIGPDTLLDITSDPSLPTVLADGLYLVQAFVTGEGTFTVGGQYAVGLVLDQTGAAQSVQALTPAATANGITSLYLPFAWFIPAGGVIECYAQNGDGVSARDFAFQAFVLKLS